MSTESKVSTKPSSTLSSSSSSDDNTSHSSTTQSPPSRTIHCDGACGARASDLKQASATGWKICAGGCGDTYCSKCSLKFIPESHCPECDPDVEDEEYFGRMMQLVPKHLADLQRDGVSIGETKVDVIPAPSIHTKEQVTSEVKEEPEASINDASLMAKVKIRLSSGDVKLQRIVVDYLETNGLLTSTKTVSELVDEINNKTFTELVRVYMDALNVVPTGPKPELVMAATRYNNTILVPSTYYGDIDKVVIYDNSDCILVVVRGPDEDKCVELRDRIVRTIGLPPSVSAFRCEFHTHFKGESLLVWEYICTNYHVPPEVVKQVYLRMQN